MSYAIAPTFEGTRIGMRRLSTLGNAGVMLGGLGDAAATAAVLVNSGAFDYGTIYNLLLNGVTDQQLTDLLNGAISITDLTAQLLAAPSGQASAPAPPQSPSGSTLLYQVAWTVGYGNLTVSSNNAVSQLQSLLPQYNMSVVAGTPSVDGLTSRSATFTIRDNVGHALVTDAKGVLDNLMKQIVGNNITGSNLSMVSNPNQPVVTAANPSDPMAWLKANWGFLALALGVVMIVPPLVKKL